mmetsp:Transcript_60099/g.141469  ORF Transcript_60099/g.141469 Transcript_60099/m.141469 type:complete len:230 (+) Transcript_60099:38-727(+)
MACSKQVSSNKKTWDAGSCLDDHAEVFKSLFRIFGAYVGPNSIPPQLGESIMVAVNSANECPYCEGLHGELARMAGVDNKKLQAASSVVECTAVVDDAAISFARTFAEKDGRGDCVEAALKDVVKAHGQAKATSVRALCWFLLWGSKGGNTLNAVLFGGRRGVFDIAFAVYYAPLFGVIAAMNKMLSVMPPMPSVFFKFIGVTLTVVGGSWLTPLGLLGVGRRAMSGGK